MCIITLSSSLYWVCCEPISQMVNLKVRAAWDLPKVIQSSGDSDGI